MIDHLQDRTVLFVKVGYRDPPDPMWILAKAQAAVIEDQREADNGLFEEPENEFDADPFGEHGHWWVLDSFDLVIERTEQAIADGYRIAVVRAEGVLLDGEP